MGAYAALCAATTRAVGGLPKRSGVTPKEICSLRDARRRGGTVGGTIWRADRRGVYVTFSKSKEASV